MVSFAHLRLLIFLPEILISTCESSSLALCMMYSVYKLKKQNDNVQPWCTPFPILNHSVVPCQSCNCCFWTYIQVSQEAGKVVWYSHFFKNFPVCCDSHKSFTIVNEAFGCIKWWEYQTISSSEEICMQVKKQQLELDMGQQTVSK